MVVSPKVQRVYTGHRTNDTSRYDKALLDDFFALHVVCGQLYFLIDSKLARSKHPMNSNPVANLCGFCRGDPRIRNTSLQILTTPFQPFDQGWAKCLRGHGFSQH